MVSSAIAEPRLLGEVAAAAAAEAQSQQVVVLAAQRTALCSVLSIYIGWPLKIGAKEREVRAGGLRGVTFSEGTLSKPATSQRNPALNSDGSHPSARSKEGGRIR